MTDTTTQNAHVSDNIKTLADRAMLVRFSRKRLRTSVRDKALEKAVRQQSGDDTVTVSKHLFRDPASPVRAVMRKYDELYRTHKEETLPWIDEGPRLLRSDRYMDYMTLMRNGIAEIEREVQPIVNNWDALVQQDIARRGSGAKLDDYPAAYEVEAQFSVDLQVMPLPSKSDFRVDVDDATKEALDRALEMAEEKARNNIIMQMLKPVKAAADKLSVPIGEEGSVFRNSLVDNVRESVRKAKELNISNDPELAAGLDAIEQEVTDTFGSEGNEGIESLRLNQTQRDKAKGKMDDILSKLGGL